MDVCVCILLKVVVIFKCCCLEVCVLMSIEVGKNYVEVDVEVVEVIDFLEYYVCSVMKYVGFGSSEMMWFEGEENGLMSILLGVGVSISFWNFFCVIFVGMVVVFIVVGNCVVVKFVEDVGLIVGFMVDILCEVGLLVGVL